jgi:hypothetical protein
MIRRHPLALLPLLCLSLPALGVAAIASASFDAPGPIETSSSSWGDTETSSDTGGQPGTTGWDTDDSGASDTGDDGSTSYTGGWDIGDGGDTGYTGGWDDGGTGYTGGWDTGDDGGSDDGGSDTGDETGGGFVDLWEPGEPGEPEDTWLLDFLLAYFFGDDDETGDETAGDETAGDETAGDETAGDDTAGEGTGDTGESGGEEDDKKPKGCAAGEFTILTYVKFLNGAEGTVSLSAGTLTALGEEKEGTTVYKEYLACIAGDKIVGPKAPGVRITAEVKGTNAADRVIGLRRGIDKTWISKCDADPAKKCWIDAKFNAEGKNTLPIAVAIVFVEFNRIEVAPMPKEVIKP